MQRLFVNEVKRSATAAVASTLTDCPPSEFLPLRIFLTVFQCFIHHRFLLYSII